MGNDGISRDERAGAAVYSKAFLTVYDLYVLTLSNRFAWECSRDALLAHYNRNLSARHLDIGPGSGWYLREANWPDAPAVALMDLNANSLDMAASRLAERGIEATRHAGSILAPFAPEIGQHDSVAANFVMHCVPGDWSEKGSAFKHIADVLSDDGVFFGSTILARGVQQNPLAKTLTFLYNGPIRAFHNSSDDLEGLRIALSQAFTDVNVEVTGTVAVWTARTPRR
ncbi:methyltransferase domain-containing protein [Rhodococcus hoagii]|nr:methyltransferase domain-containing protein [Prescottella equi]NKS10204.1 methyltransferase domain-containing protein [Prescottella equi]NKS10262.1 methyltransferase domain-containing protein [Prescottella equi]NKS35195.1 methyltransferase domain-containing protein [Prescottella equi]NKS35254.1 methyltransferase domain-containing protein [Prescottella equi]